MERLANRFMNSRSTRLLGLWSTLLTLALASAASAQGNILEAQVSEVFGTGEWTIQSVVLDGAEVPMSAEVDTSLLLITDPLALAGTVGCNRTTARFTAGDGAGSVAFGPIMSTMMACPEPAMSQERATFDALELVDSIQREGDTVVMSGPGVEIVLVAAGPVGEAPVGEDAGGEVAAGEAEGHSNDFTAFNTAVVNAADAGATWPAEALRVALAFVDLHGATDVAVTVSVGDMQAAAERPGSVVVTVVEQGLLDDALEGATQRVSLEKMDGSYWVITGHETTWQCRRGPESELIEPMRCP